ncbi:hypothetical protein FQN55_009198 [Onygenales sp. PD_40]|nr:hypothetical protein FQN55_009198 [Onygenales sp. PD_40]
MSSSQTLTTSLMGHSPHDAAPDRSAFDLGDRPREIPADIPPNLDVPNKAALDHIQSAQNTFSALSDDYKKQSDREKQSAASALLAQLLANKPASNEPEHPPPQNDPPTGDLQTHNNANDQQQQDLSGLPPLPEASANPPGAIEDNAMEAAWDMNQVSKSDKDLLAEVFQTGNLPHDLNMALGALQSDNTKLDSELDNICSGLLPLGTPKTPKDALAQSDLLAASYFDGHFSSGPTPRIVNYPELPHTEAENSQLGSESIAGSEPRIQAFAKLEFDDGHFYVNTYSFILGRDVRAARAAFQREIHARQARGQSSSGGNKSHTPNRVKHEGSAMIGSVVSDRGGIMGFDPDVPQHFPPQVSWKSSNSSRGEHARPTLHMSAVEVPPTPLETPEITKDYNALAMQSLRSGNDPKPVDTLSLLPSPDACPTIPIHPPAPANGTVATHRGISRKHVKIAYNFDRNLFEMEVIGRNGAFMGADWLAPGQVRPLHSGDFIQIGGVRVRFVLPDVPVGETGAEREESPLPEEEEAVARTAVEEDTKPASDAEAADNMETDGSENSGDDVQARQKKATNESGSKPKASSELSQDASSQPARRRGPGRPPKDGIMSKRERAEIAREQKLAAKREANGGVTPPPSSRGKTGKPGKESGAEDPASIKAEKRKYTKRKKPDGVPGDMVMPSIEGGDVNPEIVLEDTPKPMPVKKRKPSKSPSPDYPPESFYTNEDLAKPPYNYAVLIFDALTESPTPMTLKQIYRALKLKYPYFRFRCETEGWTSSVRHNLNGNAHLFEHAERDGKGWSWKLTPGASVDKEKKRRPSPPPPSHNTSQPPTNIGNNPSYLAPTPGPPFNASPQRPTEHHNPHPFPFAPGNNPFPINGGGPPPAHNSPYSIPNPPQFPIPNALRNNLPPTFAPPTTSTYRSPYASAPPPEILQAQQQQQQRQPPLQPPLPPSIQQQQQQPQPPPHPHPPQSQPQPQQSQQQQMPSSEPYKFQSQPQHGMQSTVPPPANTAPPKPPSPANNPPPNPQYQPQPQHPPHPPQPPPQPQPQPQQSHHHQQQQPSSSTPPQNRPPQPPPPPPSPPPEDPDPEPSFLERANQAIDNFEAVLMEDYEDKEYISKVLRSARDRVLNGAKESSFPGGEPKDESVIIDALRGIIGSLNENEE